MVVQKPENVLRVRTLLPFSFSKFVLTGLFSVPKVRKTPLFFRPAPPNILSSILTTFSIELIAVGQNLAALQSLHEIITSKRSKSASLQSLEPIMLRFVELCVNLRKGKMAKEGLYQFKNIAQNTNVSSIEVVHRHRVLSLTLS
jgi:hypothetical protein